MVWLRSHSNSRGSRCRQAALSAFCRSSSHGSAKSSVDVEVAPPTAINTTVADPEPAAPISPAKKPAPHIDALLSLYPSPRNLSWADEKAEEEQAAAAAQAEVQAAQEKEAAFKALQEAEHQAVLETQQTQAGVGWQDVKRPKTRIQRKKKVAVNYAGTSKTTPAKHTVSTEPMANSSNEKVELTASAVEIEATDDTEEVVAAPKRDTPVLGDGDVLPATSENIKGSQLLGDDGAATEGVLSTSIAQHNTVELKGEDTLTENCEARAGVEEKTEAGVVAPIAGITSQPHQHMGTPGEIKPVTDAVAAPVTERAWVPAATSVANTEDTVVTGAATVSPIASTGEKVSPFRKREQAATEAEITLNTSSSSSKSIGDASDTVSHVSEYSQELKSFDEHPSQQFATERDSSLATAAVEPQSVTAASPEALAKVSKPAAAAAAAATTDSWDDWIEQVPIIESRQWHVAYEAMYDAEEEAQDRHAAGVPPLDYGIMTAAELQRRHEEAECAWQTEATSSMPIEEVSNAIPEEPEDLQEPETEAQDVVSSAVPTSSTTDNPPIATTKETEVLPAPVLDAQGVPSKDLRQLSILDYFTKAAVITVEEALSTVSPENVAPPAELFTAAACQSEIPSQRVEGKAIDSINAADYLDYQPDTDDEENVEEVVLETSGSLEVVPATAISLADNARGQQVPPEPAAISLLIQRINTEEVFNGTIVGDDNAEVAQEVPVTSPELVVTRQKKKRSKAQRNAAKKRTAATATATAISTPIDDEEEESTHNAAVTAIAKHTAPKLISKGHANRQERRKAAKPSGLKKDATFVEISLAENTVINPNEQDTRTLRQNADTLFATISRKVSIWFRKTGGKQKSPVKTQKMPKPSMSLGELTESYNLMIAQGQVQASNRGLKKFKHDGAAQLAKGAQLGRQPGLSATTKARIADLDEERVVIAKAEAGSMPINWWAVIIILVPFLMLGIFWGFDQVFG